MLTRLVESARSSKPQKPERYPSLRSAMWLYLLVWLGTSAFTISLSRNIDVVFLRLLATLFITAGFTFAAVYFNKVSPTAIYGRPPTVLGLILSLLIGLAAWGPADWITFIAYTSLQSSVGVLPPVLTAAEPSQILIQAGIVAPLAQGLLFWAYIQRGAEGIGKVRGAVLTALLFAFYGLVTTDLALSSVIGLILVGLLAAFTVYVTGSAWCGTLVIMGNGIISSIWYYPDLSPTFSTILYNFLGEQIGDPLSPRRLLVLVVTAFLAFIFFQIIRATAKDTPGEKVVRARPRSLWWVPLILSLVLFVLSGLGEIALRRATNLRQQRPAPTSPGSTSPPVSPPTLTPFAIGTQPTPRQ